MNELQRQAYLSNMGIENYMPRWQLPFGPAAQQCEFPMLTVDVAVPDKTDMAQTISVLDAPPTNTLLADMNISATRPIKISATSILQQLEKKPPVEVQPFALSVWRPAPGFLIIDSRHAALALPTELLLHNILRASLNRPVDSLQEEVLRWPMIENRFVSRTASDARTELQTWLAVEHERRPVNRLWLMGDNAIRYLLSADVEPQACVWQYHQLSESELTGLILPGLNDFLQQPLLKAQLWAAIK